MFSVTVKPPIRVEIDVNNVFSIKTRSIPRSRCNLSYIQIIIFPNVIVSGKGKIFKSRCCFDCVQFLPVRP